MTPIGAIHGGTFDGVERYVPWLARLGDDKRGDYFYKFVTKGKYDPANRTSNLRLFNEVTLYVAHSGANGS